MTTWAQQLNDHLWTVPLFVEQLHCPMGGVCVSYVHLLLHWTLSKLLLLFTSILRMRIYVGSRFELSVLWKCNLTSCIIAC